MKIEHIAIAVNNLKSAGQLFASLLGTPPYKIEKVESESVTASFFKAGEVKIELLEATDVQSSVAKFIQKRGEGIHHIAFEVDNIEVEIRRLQELGFEPSQEAPKLGADNKLVCFFHPKTTNGVLIELVQSINQ